MNATEERLDYSATLEQLTEWTEEGVPIGLDRKKHLVGHYDEAGNPQFELKLPLPFPPSRTRTPI